MDFGLSEENFKQFASFISRLIGLPKDKLNIISQSILKIHPNLAGNKEMQEVIFLQSALKVSIIEREKGDLKTGDELVSAIVEQIEGGQEVFANKINELIASELMESRVLEIRNSLSDSVFNDVVAEMKLLEPRTKTDLKLAQEIFDAAAEEIVKGGNVKNLNADELHDVMIQNVQKVVADRKKQGRNR